MGRRPKVVTVRLEDLNRDEIIWAAGFFDGEGNVNCRLQNGRYPRIVCQITQVDPEVLFRFQEAVGGLGAVRGPYEYRGKVNGRDFFRFFTDAHHEVHFIMDILQPYLSTSKRKQAEEAWEKYLRLRDAAGLSDLDLVMRGIADSRVE